MSLTKKSALFMTLSFAFSWAAVGIGLALGAAENPLAASVTMFVMMFGPAFAAIVCAAAFETGQRKQALGFGWTPNWWWLFAWLIGIAFAALSVAATLLLSDRELASIGDNVTKMVLTQSPDAAADLPPPSLLTVLVLLNAVFLGPAINTPILTLSEELGWRGYLHHLWRPFGYWRCSLATGFVWGLWHAPAIWLLGLNYPDHRLIGIALFVLFCMMFSPLMTLVRDHGRSVIAAGVLHGTLNALGGLTLMALSDAAFPWNGIVGIGGFIALALLLAILAAWRARAMRPAPA